MGEREGDGEGGRGREKDPSHTQAQPQTDGHVNCEQANKHKRRLEKVPTEIK